MTTIDEPALVRSVGPSKGNETMALTRDEALREVDRLLRESKDRTAKSVGFPVVACIEGMGFQVVPDVVVEMLRKGIAKSWPEKIEPEPPVEQDVGCTCDVEGCPG